MPNYLSIYNSHNFCTKRVLINCSKENIENKTHFYFVVLPSVYFKNK